MIKEFKKNRKITIEPIFVKQSDEVAAQQFDKWWAEVSKTYIKRQRKRKIMKVLWGKKK